MKVDPLEALAVSVTGVPASYDWLQSLPQLMPDGLDKVLKPEEIADLVAYLKASKPPAGSL